jgi:hypothetical protein
MAITLGHLEHLIYEMLNSSKSAYGTFDGNPNYKTLGIRRIILDKDMTLATLIAANPGQPERTLYKTVTTLSPQGVWLDIPSAQSEATSIEIVTMNRGTVTGIRAPAAKIVNWIKHPAVFGGLDIIEGYYDIQQNQILFSGQSVNVVNYVVTPHTNNPSDITTPDTYTLRAPDNFRDVLAAMVMAEILSKPGGHNELAAAYHQKANDLLSVLLKVSAEPIFAEIQQQKEVIKRG